MLGAIFLFVYGTEQHRWMHQDEQIEFRTVCDRLFFRIVRRLSGKYPAILNISRTSQVALMYLGRQSEEPLLCIREQSLCRGASQSAVRRRWLTLCTAWPSRSQISSLSTANLALGKAISCREPNLCCRGADRPGRCDALPKKKACMRAVEWAGALSRWRWLARSVIVNATVTQYTSSVNGVSLPTD